MWVWDHALKGKHSFTSDLCQKPHDSAQKFNHYSNKWDPTMDHKCDSTTKTSTIYKIVKLTTISPRTKEIRIEISQNQSNFRYIELKYLGLWKGPTLLAYRGTWSPSLYLWFDPSPSTPRPTASSTANTTAPSSFLIAIANRISLLIYEERLIKDRIFPPTKKTAFRPNLCLYATSWRWVWDLSRGERGF